MCKKIRQIIFRRVHTKGRSLKVPAEICHQIDVYTHILQAGAVLVFVEVVMLPKTQQVVEVVEEAAWVFLRVFLFPQVVQVEW